MCTVTFIPKKNNEFILTSNRDESATRSPENITTTKLYGQQVLFPRDKGAGGTWIACSTQNKLVCLLNGAFDRHDRHPPYKKSRGLMVLEFFQFTDANQFFATFDFRGMESFTMIIYDNGRLWDFRWDEIMGKYFIKSLNTKEYHIWSSATLYEKPIQRKREQWLEEWLKGRTDFSKEAILELHQKGGEGNPSNDFMMNRYNYLVQTVSITQVVGNNQSMQMIYHDLINHQVKNTKLILTNLQKKVGWKQSLLAYLI